MARRDRRPAVPTWRRQFEAYWGSSLISEFIGTFTLLFVGVGAITLTQGGNLVAIALAHGLAIALMVTTLGHISGGVFNPALVIALIVTRRLEVAKGGGVHHRAA